MACSTYAATFTSYKGASTFVQSVNILRNLRDSKMAPSVQSLANAWRAAIVSDLKKLAFTAVTKSVGAEPRKTSSGP